MSSRPLPAGDSLLSSHPGSGASPAWSARGNGPSPPAFKSCPGGTENSELTSPSWKRVGIVLNTNDLICEQANLQVIHSLPRP